MPAMHKQRFLGMLASAACLTACGSTVATRTTVGADGNLDVRPSAPTSSAGVGLGPTTTPGSSAGVDTSVGTTGSGLAPGIGSGTSGVPTTGVAGPLPGRNGPGVSDKEIVIGVPLIGDASALETVGLAGWAVAAADLQKAAQSAIDDINAHGGIAGRRLRAIYTSVQTFTSPNYDQTAQQVCETFTNDHKVFAVVGSLNKNPSQLLPTCLARRGVVYVEGINSLYLDGTLTSSLEPYYYRPADLGMSRLDLYIGGLADAGFLTRTSKVGVLYYDDASGTRTYKTVIAPALRALGIADVQSIAFPKPTGSTDNSPSAAARSAVLQFQTAGVDRVIFVASSGDIPFYFMPAAQSQAYHPAYGLSSADSPSGVALIAAPGQLDGARVVGWDRTKDISRAEEARQPGNPMWVRCVAAQRKYGDASKAESQAYLCDPFYLLQRAFQGPTTPITATSLRAGIDRLGTSYQLSEPYVTRFHPRSPGAVGALLYRAFDASCTCFVPTGSTHPVS